jgi:uncharacterized protein YkwD
LLLALVLLSAFTSSASASTRTQVLATVATPAVCPNANLVPDAGNLDLIRGALDCLHDQVRTKRGLGTLAANRALAAAAGSHTEDMIARGYFDHDTPEGSTFDKRILSAGYARKGQGWSLGENLIWATGDLATPSALMRSWMGSKGHRANILNARYRELGLAVRLGTPTGDAGVTVSAEFGARRR